MGFVFLAIVIFFAVMAISNQLRESRPQGRPHFKLGTDGVPRLVEYR